MEAEATCVEILLAQNNRVVLCDERGGKRLRSDCLADDVIRRMKRLGAVRFARSTPISRYPAQVLKQTGSEHIKKRGSSLFFIIYCGTKGFR